MYQNLRDDELAKKITEVESRIDSVNKQIEGLDEYTVFIDLKWAYKLLDILYPQRDELYEELHYRKTSNSNNKATIYR